MFFYCVIVFLKYYLCFGCCYDLVWYLSIFVAFNRGISFLFSLFSLYKILSV